MTVLIEQCYMLQNRNDNDMGHYMRLISIKFTPMALRKGVLTSVAHCRDLGWPGKPSTSERSDAPS